VWHVQACRALSPSPAKNNRGSTSTSKTWQQCNSDHGSATRLPCMQDGQAAAGGGAPHPTPGNPESSSPFLGTAGAGQPPAGHTSSPAVVAAAAAAVTEVGRSLSLVAPPQPQAQPRPQPQPHTQVKEALTNRYITSPRELPAGLPTMLRKAAWNMSSLRRQTWSGGSHRQRGCSRVSPRAAGGRRQAAGGRRQAAGGRRQAAGGRRQAAL
jgi:hypothetical protein